MNDACDSSEFYDSMLSYYVFVHDNPPLRGRYKTTVKALDRDDAFARFYQTFPRHRILSINGVPIVVGTGGSAK